MKTIRTTSTRMEVAWSELPELLKLPKGAEIDDVLLRDDVIVVVLKDSVVSRDLSEKGVLSAIDPAVRT